MGKVSKPNDVLKLVRAGGIVELYKHPIKAAQIMERHPRHCVTRPDFFRNPYIVVRPESVLKPGQVFFIVPYHTIYRLLKSRRNRSHYTTPDHHKAVNKQTVENIHQLDNMTDTCFFHQIVVPVINIRNTKQNNRHLVNFSLEVKRNNCAFDQDGDSDYDEDVAASGASGCFPTHKKGGNNKEASKDSAGGCLKPCLRKYQASKTRAPQGPRVRFMLPEEKWDEDFPEF